MVFQRQKKRIRENWGTWLAIIILVTFGALYLIGGQWFHGLVGMGRHHQGMMQGIPAKYANLANPIASTEASILKGKVLYREYCGSCHGPSGRGDGPAGRDLSPQPADLVSLQRMSITTDSYIFWAISDGGKQFKSKMPAFKSVLTETERWHLANYLKTL